MTRLPLAPFAVALALLFAACGGDDGSSGVGGGEGVTTQAFAQQANRVCTTFSDETRAASQRLQEGTSTEEAVAAVDQLSESGRRGRQQLQALELPSGADRGTAERFVATSVRVIDLALPELDALRTAVEQEDQGQVRSALQDLQEDPPENAESDRLAQQIGATACVE